MASITITFSIVPELQMSEMRAVGFLEGHQDLDAAEKYDSFPQKHREQIGRHMEHWTAGNNGPKNWFHGFPNRLGHKECFEFKYRSDRLLGFLCHPCPYSNPAFLLCVLTTYHDKHEWQIDDALLDDVELWRNSLASRKAIGYTYPEYVAGVAWTN